MLRFQRILMAAALCAALAVTGLPAFAQTASALLREDDALPGAPGETVSSINNPVVNHAGGYAVTVNTTGSGTTLSNVWGSADGGAGGVIITEGTYGDFQQMSFESFHGFSNDGTPSYSASSTSLITGTTGLDGVWTGTTPVLNEEDPVPSLPGMFSTFNSRPGITGDGVPYWVGGVTSSQGGGTQDRVLFFSADATPVLMGGDVIGGVAEPVDTGSSSIDFDYRFSALGSSYISPVNVDAATSSDGVLVINGDALILDGGVVREASPLPAAIGGLPGENWDNFDFMGITEGGQYFFTGDSDAPTGADEFVLLNGEIVLREGQTVEGPDGPLPLSGSIEGGYLNEDGDWTVIWDVDDAAGNVEVLLLNGELLLKEGDAVDLDGDGATEANSILANFTGLTALVISDRDAAGMVSIYFTADIDTEGTTTSTDDTEGYFRFVVQAGAPAISLPLDIKPGNCPAVHNVGSNGFLRVGLLGTADVDITQVDLSTVTISRADGVGGSVAQNEGPQGPQTRLGDVASAFEGEVCDCQVGGGDGLNDLSLHFPSREMAEILDLESVSTDALFEFEVSGLLIDGTAFSASDCIRIVPAPGRPTVEVVDGESSEKTFGLANNAEPKDSGAPPVRTWRRAGGNSLDGLGQLRDVRARLQAARQLLTELDPAMQPLLEGHLRQIRDDAERDGEPTIAREAQRLLHVLQPRD